MISTYYSGVASKPMKDASDLLQSPYTYVLQRGTDEKKECERNEWKFV